MDHTPIKHLVISGGHVWGLYAMGAIREAINQKFIDLSNIESFYCTSIGAIIAVILSLDMDMDILYKYLIERPWFDYFKQRLYSPVDVFHVKGVYGKNILYDFFTPLFRSKDLDLDITLLEFYKITEKDIHIFTTEFNAFISVDLSYKTHPDWKLMDAVYCSIGVPFLLAPTVIGDKCYFDGGLTNNYPIEPCIADHPGIDTDSILSILLGIEPRVKQDVIYGDMEFLDYTSTLVAKLVKRLIVIHSSIKLKHEIIFYEPENPGECLMNIVQHASTRREILELGAKRMTEYIETL